jgi:hypothetical protein
MPNRLHSLAGKVDKVVGIGPVDSCRLDAFIPGRQKKLAPPNGGMLDACSAEPTIHAEMAQEQR